MSELEDKGVDGMLRLMIAMVVVLVLYAWAPFAKFMGTPVIGERPATQSTIVEAGTE